MYLFIEYPKCTTCKKAKAWLTANNIEFTDRHIAEETPKAEELKAWAQRRGESLRKFFNTSGMKYRELGLKDKLGDMSEDEMAELLADDGMLIKRPLLIGEEVVLKGFKEKE
ncbi:MAG: arsenate reductase family protein [Clostridiales bacterium]|nr:arsenate reductase family protein [Clostridiales bacterium]